jgi:hypothetical protein
MNTLYKLTEKLNTELTSNELIKTVTYGDITDVDLDKMTIFPLAHVNLSGASISSSTVNVGVSVLLMDIVDISKTHGDNFVGNDNEHDVLNSMLAAATKTFQEFLRGSSYADGFQVEEDATVDFFTDRFENKLAGVSLEFNVSLKNSAELC